jgi:PST family polysaccharide transporter
VPILNSFGFIIAGVWSLFIIKRDFGIKFIFQRLDVLKYYLKDGWHVFISQLNISLFSSSNIIILGIFTNNVAVGYYSVAEKIMRALAMMQAPITGAIFPHISNLIKNNKAKAVSELKKIIKIGTIAYIILFLIVIIFTKEIILLLFSSKALNSVIILKIIAIVPLTIFLNNIFGTQIMLNTGKSKQFSKVLFIGAIINIILCSILSYYFSYIGTAISLLIVEIFIMFGMFYYVKGDLYEN